MKTRSFVAFAAPSVLLMLLLLALPLLMTLWLSVRSCAPDLQLVTVQQSGPFGEQAVVTQRARTDAGGRAVQVCRFVGLDYYRKLLGIERGVETGVQTGGEASVVSRIASSVKTSPGTNNPKDAASPSLPHNEFWAALQFTLIYVATTTPLILLGGLLLALAVNRATKALRGAFIAASLLPFIITPVVGALAIKWLFRDDGLVPHLLSQVGVQIFWMAQAWSARLLICIYGVWHVLPFAFIVLYAGLQSVPQDALEAAMLDGASPTQRLRFVTLPHLMPLLVFVTLIHLMDAYRVFEPVLVLTQGAFTTSVQYLTYYVLLEENNPFKASAAAVLTLLGIALLLVPLLRRTWREQRQGF
jgi:multiple sugar transport system permease protein